MWKKMTAMVTGLAVVASLSACGANGGADNGASNPNPAGGSGSGKKITLNYWTDDRHDQQYIQTLVDQFNQTNGGIEVKLNVLSDNYNQSIDIAFAGNQAPDILRVKSGNFLDFQKKGYLAPIGDYLNADSAMKQKFAGTLIEGANQIDGKIYSLPNTGQTLRLVYNKDLFAKAGIQNPPATLQEMVDAAKKITAAGKAEGAYGFALNFKSPLGAMQRSVREILSLSGYQGLGFDIKTGKFDFGPTSQVIQAFKQMYDDKSMLPGVETLDIDPLRAQFAAGKIGMYLSFATEPGVYKDQFPTKVNWAGALPPTIDGKVNGTSEIVSAGTWLGISNNSQNKDAAWKFLQFMYADNVLTTYHEKGFGIAVVPSIAAKAKKPDMPGMDGFLVTKYDSLWPVSPTVTPEGANYGDAFMKYMMTGGDLSKVVSDLNTRYNAALDKAVQAGSVKVKPDPSFDPLKLQGK
ncbi:hypothetical protein PAESOLCIP111_01168 [Paenibacillus solanacearum]|uniref:ABC transporter substrate-binding protein n=1 Tax=Paenibacillus solanacearum TaxID=2048548 RepID=A0A916JWJ5_9BACL|nr:sugar ABC transporter substrate-binding protein [Paenibacillus solanacearum]CAG7609436.1 hypothetical protein PAESOLCIP111_01168 [Paenibacillus solanacearum]